MKFLLFLTASFASKHKYGEENGELTENTTPEVMVKIEEDESVNKGFSSRYLGVSWNKNYSKWHVQRISKLDGRIVHGGNFNVDEEMKAALASDILAIKLMQKGEEGHKFNFPTDGTEEQA